MDDVAVLPVLPRVEPRRVRVAAAVHLPTIGAADRPQLRHARRLYCKLLATADSTLPMAIRP